MDFEIIAPIVANLGVGAIFVYIYWKEREDRIWVRNKKDEINDKVLEAFKDNTKVIEKNTQTTEKTGEAVDRLSQMVYDVLKDTKR